MLSDGCRVLHRSILPPEPSYSITDLHDVDPDELVPPRSPPTSAHFPRAYLTIGGKHDDIHPPVNLRFRIDLR